MKAIQICSAVHKTGDSTEVVQLFALCDDGSIWVHEPNNKSRRQLPSILPRKKRKEAK